MALLDELKARFDKLKEPVPELHGPAKWVDDRVSPDLKSQGFRPTVGVQKAADLGRAALDAADYFSTVVSGGIYGLGAGEAAKQANEGNAGLNNSNVDLAEADRRAKAITDNPIEQAHLRNEFYAEKHGTETGVMNMLTSPDNLATVGGRALGVVPKAAQQAGVARAGATRTIGKTVGVVDTLKDYGEAVKATGRAVKLAHRKGAAEQKLADTGAKVVEKVVTTGAKGKKGERYVVTGTGEVIREGSLFGPKTPKIEALEKDLEKLEEAAMKIGKAKVVVKGGKKVAVPGTAAPWTPVQKRLTATRRKLYAAKKEAGWTKVEDPFLQQLAQTPGSTYVDTGIASTKSSIVESTTENVRQPFRLRDVYQTWMQSMVITPRQLIQDATQLAVWGKDKGLSGREMARAWTSIIDDATVRAKSMPLSEAMQQALPRRMSSLADHFGWTVDQDSLMKEFGSGFLEANTQVKKYLAPWQTAAIEAALPNASGTVSNVPILGNAIGAISGRYRAYQNAAFGAFNHFQHTAARTVAFEDGFSRSIASKADEFLARAEKVDPKAAEEIKNRSVQFYNRRVYGDLVEMDGYNPNSLFTPEDVATAFGADSPLVGQWKKAVEAAKADGGKRAKEVFADFSNAGSDNRSLVIPYLSYPLKAYPRTFEMMLDHPTGALIVYHLVEASQEEAKERGLPTYAAGGFTIDQDTKVLGFMARVLNGGREGTSTIQPIGLLTPMPTEAPDIREQDKPFDKIDKLIGSALPSFSPLIKTPAYMLGLSDQTPGNFSRLQGPAALMPGPEGPTFRQYLEAERDVIGESAPYDPIAQIAKELVYTRSQAPLEDPRNMKYAVEIQNKTGIYEEAEDIYNKQLAGRNAVGFFNPTNTVNVSAVAAERNKAQKTLISAEEKAALAALDPKYAVVVDRINAERSKGTAARVNNMPDIPKELKKDPRLVAWERDKKNVAMRQSFPAKYKAEREQFIRSNRIKE